MIESEDNAENKIYHVISVEILKNANLATFSKEFFGKLFLSVKYISWWFQICYKTFWSNFV